MAKVILGTLVFYVLLIASVFSQKVDHLMLWIVVGLVGAVILYGIISWIVGEISLWWECVRPNPKTPEHTPVYWPEKHDA